MPEPIVLRSFGGSPRRAALVWGAWCGAIALAALLAETRTDCRGYGCPGSVAVLALFLGAFMPLRILWKGRAGLELRLDDAGITVEGSFIPWPALVAAGWVLSPGRVPTPRVEVRVMTRAGYDPPRDPKVLVDHERYHVPTDALLDAIVARAPHVLIFARDPDVSSR